MKNCTMTSIFNCHCFLTACKAPKLKNGKLKIIGKKSGPHIVPGTKLQFKCNRNHRLIGSPIRECLETGGWSGFRAKCVGSKYILTVFLTDLSVIYRQSSSSVSVLRFPRIGGYDSPSLSIVGHHYGLTIAQTSPAPDIICPRCSGSTASSFACHLFLHKYILKISSSI